MSDAVLVSWQRPTPARRWPIRFVLGGLAAACAVLTGALALPTGLAALQATQPSVPPPVPRSPQWIDIARPFHLYDLAAPDLRGLIPVYSARRRPADGGREDRLTFGVPGRDAASLSLQIVRHPSKVAAAPLFAVTARQAAEAGLSTDRSSLADAMPTRFGTFEVAELALRESNGTALPCSGFRFLSSNPGLSITGMGCGLPGKPMTRSALACMIDRLDLVSGGDDRELVDFFASSESRRDITCAGARLAPDKVHAAWLDDKPVTPRKTPRHR